jgi:CRP-like cAMP-binding protein
MFFIETGAVRVVSQGKKLLASLEDGECFGESALFDAKPRSAGVIASKKTTLLVINREQVQVEINKETSMVRLIVLLLIKRLEVMNILRLREQGK